MPSANRVDPPREAVEVAEQYLGRERPVTALVVFVAVSIFLGTYAATSLLPAAAVAAVLLLVVRVPLLRTSGTARLRTDDDPASVVDAFAGPTPPVLALQWGIADDVTVEDGTARYRVSYLFGLRSTEMTVDTETTTDPSGDRRVEMRVEAGGRPWGTYGATIRDAGDGTVVDYDYRSDRRFGLRRAPQQLLAARYRGDALAAQGYATVERDTYVGF